MKITKGTPILIQQPYKKAKYPKEFEYIKPIKYALNCSLFINDGSNRQNEIIGRTQGYNEAGGKINNKPDKDGWYDVVITKDDKLKYGDFNSWDYPDVKLGFTCQGIIVEDGKRVSKWSKGREYIANNTTEKSLFIQFKDGYGLAEEGKGTSYEQVANKLIKQGALFVAVLDGGGSTTGNRKVPNVLAILGPISTDDGPKEEVAKPIQKESGKMKLLVEFDKDYDKITFLNAKKGQRIYIEEKYIKPQYTSNNIRFTQLSHEGGAYDFGDNNKGVDEIYMPYDGKVLYEGYDKPFYDTGAIVTFVESILEIEEGKKAITWIWHMSKTFVDANRIYSQGDLIGYEGNTGISTASHSHIGMAVVPLNYKFNADLNTFKHLMNYAVDLVDYSYIYPHQKLMENELSKKIANRIKKI